jgi:hypothetical protein
VVDAEAARLEALETLEELYRNPGIDPREWAGWRLEVTTASGAVGCLITDPTHPWYGAWKRLETAIPAAKEEQGT